ncbi:DUF4105 domain-containing protein [Psychrobacter frigidicola]|uniref:DUF4105 domain-containing protein n=2 Tax=Psychrobacter frigidicola TaxID=45611 RepID=A0A5C7A298_9GAMM|nr:DUF4105 domain-containing protein [Psychrobacter frigidicola]
MTTGELADTATPALTNNLTVKRSISSVNTDNTESNQNTRDTQTVVNAQNIKNTRNVQNAQGNANTANTQSAQATNAEQLLSTWREHVKTDNLSQHTTWRRLLYFIDDEKSIFSKGKTKSLVADSSFFLSATGQQDSGAELDAMLVALSEQLTRAGNGNKAISNKGSAQANNNSALCRFPARVQWLTDTLNIDDARLQLACPELDDWMATLAPEQLSVMFAQEYLDNPISAFGHTLLRIDSQASAADFNQIHHAYALNDTVDGDTADSFVVFAIKAMSGGYNNSIEIDPYPKKLADYLKDDERDTWTYQLDLTPTEVRQIMAHVWETKDLEIPYYFATDNCASEILRLIDVVRPEKHLLSQLPYVVIPSDVVNLLDKEKMLVSTRYTPSDSTVRQAQLNTARQAAKLGYQGLDKETENKIKSAASNPASSMSEDKQVLQAPMIAVSNNNPLDRHPLQRGQMGIGHRGDNSYIDVGLRAGFHDILDRPAGFKQFFNLEGVDATLRFYDTDDDKDNKQPSSVVLQNFTLIRGRSFNPVNTAQKGQTWGANIEATRINDGSQQEGTDHLVGSTTLEYGKSWAFGTPRTGPSGLVTGEMPPQLCYTLATGTVQAGRGINKGYRVGAGVNAGCLYQINNQLRAQAELQLPYWYHGSSDEPDVRGHYWQPITTLGLQYDIDKKQALRLNASYDWQDRVDANEDIKLAYMRYF